MKIHYIEHVPFETPAQILIWAKNKEYQVTSTKVYKDELFPALDSFDILIIMGGPMSVNDEKIYSWISKEKEFIKSAIDKNKKVLGFCLGAQFIVSALGGSVYSSTEKEIGWYPVIMERKLSGLEDFPNSFIPFSWHGETFDLPENCSRLAGSIACQNQAFSMNDGLVLGLQFHLELAKNNILELANECSAELINTKYIECDINKLTDNTNIMNANKLLIQLLNYMEKL